MMRAHELETKVLGIVDRVVQGQPVEDSLVELKAQWTDHQRMARRIAGHANAAHGQPIIWIIGVDEAARKVVGATKTDLASWYPQVSACFDEIPPDLIIDLAVPYEEQTLVALLFDTSRAPYVVKGPKGREDHREVPWRKGTEVISARRQDLLRLLSPMQAYPKVEVLDAKLTVFETRGLSGPSGSLGRLNVRVLIAPRGGTPLAFPSHMASARIEHPSSATPVILKDAEFKPIIPVTIADPRTHLGSTVVFSAHVAQFNGAEAVQVEWQIASVEEELAQICKERDIAATVSLCALEPEIRVQIALSLGELPSRNTRRHWLLRQHEVGIHPAYSDESQERNSGSYEE